MAGRHVGRDTGVQLVLGLTIIVAGLLFTLDNLRIVRAGDYLRYWPVALVAIGVVQIVQARTSSRIWSGGIWMTIGAAMLVDRLGFLRVNVWSFWPLILVMIGGRIFWQSFGGESRPPTVEPQNAATTPPAVWPTTADSGDRASLVASSEPAPFSTSDGSTISATALLGSFARKVKSTAFRRAELTAVMGGGKLDLLDASVADGGAVIDVFALMGGFEIRVPDSWNVEVEVTPFMGNCDDKTVRHTGGTAPRVTVRGFVMMGGVDIKNGR